MCEINSCHVTNGDRKLPTSNLLHAYWCHSWRSTAVASQLRWGLHAHGLQHMWMTQQNVTLCVVLCCRHWWARFVEQWVRNNATPSSKNASDWAEGRMRLICRTLMHFLPFCSGGELVQGPGRHLANQWKWLEFSQSGKGWSCFVVVIVKPVLENPPWKVMLYKIPFHSFSHY